MGRIKNTHEEELRMMSGGERLGGHGNWQLSEKAGGTGRSGKIFYPVLSSQMAKEER